MFETPSNDLLELSSLEASTKPPETSGVPCRTCGGQMQLVHAEADQRYTNLDVATYTCECGRNADLLIARTE
jgi:hypothetical protein